MEKWASKWLEMRSQIHRFKKKSGGGPPAPTNGRGVQPPSHTLPTRGFRRSVQNISFQCPPPATTSLGPALRAVMKGCNVVHIMNALNSLNHIYEPRHEKTNFLVSDLVRHKPGCTATEDC